jgi:hypothetical protein
VRHLLALHRSEQITRHEVCQRLNLGKSAFYALRTDYLRACAAGASQSWEPRASGGQRHALWPPDAQELAHKLLRGDPPASYSCVASELLRRTGFKTDRSTVRRWAQAHGCALPARPKGHGHRASVRRWQRAQLGELWQLDATPHAFIPGSDTKWHLIEMLDDCSRLVTGARLYARELLLSYYDLLPRAFLEHGLPLALYVDYHSLFHTHTPDALTELGRALRFYGVSLQYAATAQAKGKVERLHHYWQNRLPALFGAEGISQIAPANVMLEELRAHHNSQEQHRELGMTALQAWRRAKRAQRGVLRVCKRDPWWHYVWSQRTGVRVADDGTVPVAGQRMRVCALPRTRLVHCLHTNGSITILANQPDKNTRPIILLHCGPKLD